MANLVQERTFEETRALVAAEVKRIIPTLDTSNPRTPEGQFVNALTASVTAHDRIANRVADELTLTRATGAFLDARGAEYGVRRRPAAPARGTVLFTGTASTSIPSQTRIAASNGVEFLTDFSAIVNSDGEVGVTVTATVNGIAGNITSDVETLSLSQPIAGVDAVGFATDTETFVGGGGAENDDDYRERLLARSRAAVAGGNRSDWEGWVRAVPNVRTVRVYDPPAGGQILIYVAFTREAAPEYGVPSDDDLDDIRNRLESLRPIGTRVDVLPVRARKIDINIANVVPDSEAVRTAIENAVRAFFLNTSQVGGTLYLKTIRDALNVAGLVDADIIDPAAAVVLETDQIPVLGTLNVA